ncbi:AMP-binding protein [Nocardia sp. NPDC004604]|uniref:(2,3-dihydroxybenzoyl)adenylate synthase n=1 Tax=Nocardia sp. NPDC004604 TaxID=3157013 RepID=UPI0033ACFE17
MLEGFTPWPQEFAERYRAQGFWSGETLGAVLRQAAERYGDRTALVHDDRRIGYRDLDAWADRLAALFQRHGVRSDDRVLVQLPNIPEFVAITFALLRIGAKPVFCLVAHRETEVGHLVRLSGATHYVLPDTYREFRHRDMGERIHATHDQLRSLFLVGGRADGFVSIEDADQEPYQTRLPETDPADVAFFLLSGGTTALPKLIPRTHDDYVYQSLRAAEVCELNDRDVYLAALPIEFNFAWGCPGVIGTFHTGGTVVLADTPNPMDCFPLIERERVTVTALVPSLVAVWLEVAEWASWNLSSLRLLQVGGARMTREFTASIGPTLGCELQQVFGMAEGLLCFSRPDDPAESVLTTQGKPISDADEIVIADADGTALAPGEVGELLTRGPYTLRGYYAAPEHNRVAFTADGFYRTGDLARLTRDGDLVIEGRIKDMIIRGGDKVNAGEVEEHLLGCPGVRAVAVVGVPDPFLGERTCAFVVPTAAAPNPAELKQAMHARGVAAYKIPDDIEIVVELPLTPLGKVDKKALVRTRAGASITGVPS